MNLENDLDKKREEIEEAVRRLELLREEYTKMLEEYCKLPSHYDYEYGEFPLYKNKNKCPACGLEFSGVMGYVCSRNPCPSGFGGVWC